MCSFMHTGICHDSSFMPRVLRSAVRLRGVLRTQTQAQLVLARIDRPKDTGHPHTNAMEFPTRKQQMGLDVQSSGLQWHFNCLLPPDSVFFMVAIGILKQNANSRARKARRRKGGFRGVIRMPNTDKGN